MNDEHAYEHERTEAIDPEILSLLSSIRKQPPVTSVPAHYGALPDARGQQTLRFIAWLVGGAVGAVAVILAVDHWVTGLNTLREKVTTIEAQVKEASATVAANQRLISAQGTLIETLTKEVFGDDRKRMIKEHIEIESMRKRGQSNKESFFLEHGYEAPSMIPNARKE